MNKWCDWVDAVLVCQCCSTHLWQLWEDTSPSGQDSQTAGCPWSRWTGGHPVWCLRPSRGCPRSQPAGRTVNPRDIDQSEPSHPSSHQLMQPVWYWPACLPACWRGRDRPGLTAPATQRHPSPSGRPWCDPLLSPGHRFWQGRSLPEASTSRDRGVTGMSRSHHFTRALKIHSEITSKNFPTGPTSSRRNCSCSSFIAVNADSRSGKYNL